MRRIEAKVVDKRFGEALDANFRRAVGGVRDVVAEREARKPLTPLVFTMCPSSLARSVSRKVRAMWYTPNQQM